MCREDLKKFPSEAQEAAPSPVPGVPHLCCPCRCCPLGLRPEPCPYPFLERMAHGVFRAGNTPPRTGGGFRNLSAGRALPGQGWLPPRPVPLAAACRGEAAPRQQLGAKEWGREGPRGCTAPAPTRRGEGEGAVPHPGCPTDSGALEQPQSRAGACWDLIPTDFTPCLHPEKKGRVQIRQTSTNTARGGPDAHKTPKGSPERGCPGPTHPQHDGVCVWGTGLAATLLCPAPGARQGETPQQHRPPGPTAGVSLRCPPVNVEPSLGNGPGGGSAGKGGAARKGGGPHEMGGLHKEARVSSVPPCRVSLGGS